MCLINGKNYGSQIRVSEVKDDLKILELGNENRKTC